MRRKKKVGEREGVLVLFSPPDLPISVCSATTTTTNNNNNNNNNNNKTRSLTPPPFAFSLYYCFSDYFYCYYY